MTAKKKTKKKSSRSKKAASKKSTSVKTARRPKKLAKKLSKKKPVARSAKQQKTSGKKQPRQKTGRSGVAAFSPEGSGLRSGEQSGDLQGLSRLERADSESVDELLEEGNAFEADVVSGVEGAGDEEEKEVRTHEVPEDDVPEEYLDEK